MENSSSEWSEKAAARQWVISEPVTPPELTVWWRCHIGALASGVTLKLVTRIVTGLVVLIAVAAIVGGALIWRPGIAAIEPPFRTAFAAEQIVAGEVLAAAGDCATCHTAKGGKPLAGGLGLETGFGTIFSSNITPDPYTGIGRWSLAAFTRALRDGVDRDGVHLFPAFPYDHFTKVNDADIAALYAFLMTQPAVSIAETPNTLAFPFNIRALQAGWKLLFFSPGRFVPAPDRSEAWNRGAYLAEGLAHCGGCHTPRNRFGAEIRSQAYAGGIVDGRNVPALTSANQSPVPWTEDELYAVLRGTPVRLHLAPGGSMAAIIRDGLGKLPDADIRALAVYFADIAGGATRVDETRIASARALGANDLDQQNRREPAVALYLSACAACHYSAGSAGNPSRPDLALATAINAPDPAGLLRRILFGHKADMPAFGTGLSDAEIAAIASYLRASRSGAPPWLDLTARVGQIRATGARAATTQ